MLFSEQNYFAFCTEVRDKNSISDEANIDLMDPPHIVVAVIRSYPTHCFLDPYPSPPSSERLEASVAFYKWINLFCPVFGSVNPEARRAGSEVGPAVRPG